MRAHLLGYSQGPTCGLARPCSVVADRIRGRGWQPCPRLSSGRLTNKKAELVPDQWSCVAVSTAAGGASATLKRCGATLSCVPACPLLADAPSSENVKSFLSHAFLT